MSSYDLFKELSELDEDLILEPRKFVSLRLNLLFCLLAANISAPVPDDRPVLSILVYLLAFGAMYACATWFLNRKRKRRLLIQDDIELG